MRAKTLILLGACLLIAVAGGLAWQEHHATRTKLSLLATAAKRRTTLEAELQQMETWRAALEKARGPLRPPSEPEAKVPATGPKGTGQANPRPNATDLILKDPKLQMLYLAAARFNQAMTFGPLFVALKLSPAQQEHFMDIAMAREQTNTDLLAVRRAQGLSADDPAVAALRQEAADEAKSAQLALLGPAGYQQVLEYGRTLPVRFMVGQFAGAAAVEGSPLSLQQAEQMTQALAAASSAYRSGGSVDYLSLDWDAADQQIAGILTPAQRNLYQTTALLGDGISQWSGRLLRAFDQAKKAEAASTTPVPPKPPGS